MISKDEIEKFQSWMEDAKATEPNDPNAMFLATVDETGLPNVRTVLLKSFDANGFVFFTNFESAKGRELAENNAACLCFHWKTLRRTITIRGYVEQVANDEADTYFQSRPRLSRLGARASQQSRPLRSRRALLLEVAKLSLKFGFGPVPRPKHWGGFRLSPTSLRFHEE